MRKIASIQRIHSLHPIPDADMIVKATVLGWELVVKKGEFEEGDLCVYVEIDGLLPPKPEFEFLASKKYRIRTIKLKGQISQGICFPLSILPAGTPIEEDLDVSEILGITKYEAPIPTTLMGAVRGTFPVFIPKTDETRVQVLQKELFKHAGKSAYITEKLDGSSATFYLKDGDFGVCSRNYDLERDPENAFWRVALALNMEEKLRNFGKNIALQGELIGEGIQKNKYGLKGLTVRFFTAFDIDRYRRMTWVELQDLTALLGLETVPLLEEHWVISSDIPTILEKAEIKATLNPKVLAEGIIIRLHEDPNVSFKAINNQFLLKYAD